MPTSFDKRKYLFVRMLLSAIVIVALTLLFRRFVPVNALTAGFAYLVTILLFATFLGLLESVVASTTATFCLNYFFLPPFGTLTIADPENWVALFAFLITSLVASQLSDRAKRRAHEAMQGRLEMERLYALSRSVMLADSARPAAAQLADEILRIYELSGVTVYDRSLNQTYEAGAPVPDVEGPLNDIMLGGRCLGGIAVGGKLISDASLNALLNLAAIVMENANNRDVATTPSKKCAPATLILSCWM